MNGNPYVKTDILDRFERDMCTVAGAVECIKNTFT